MSTDAPSRKHITLDEALGIISDIARGGEGADQMRALKLVMSQESGASHLPAPLTDAEVLERLARILRAAGPTACQLAYRKAFPSAQKRIHDASARVTAADVAPVDERSLPDTLKQLYRAFPEIKPRTGGIPKGYPLKSGMAVRKQWCHREARKMILDREQAKLDTIAMHADPDATPDA